MQQCKGHFDFKVYLVVFVGSIVGLCQKCNGRDYLIMGLSFK
jgi:hypothetical protein